MRSPMDYEDPVCADIKNSEELFFFESSNVNLVAQAYNEARRLCGACQHLNECAEWGIHYEMYGLWGGLAPKEREEIRKRRKITRVQPPGVSA